MTNKFAQIRRCIRDAWTITLLALVIILMPIGVMAAPYADFVIDARTGEVLHQTNADTRLHPASLTKMMTLYIAFQAIEHGEISLDTMVTVSKGAASQAPSRLGLKPGQRIAMRYLIRAAAIKSANDAAYAIGEAIEGSREAFAARMNRTAKALGMTRTTFKNPNGLTAEGHLSTARDMTTLGRRLFYDFPQYYGIFSRRTADAGIAQVASTNRRFLDSYEGADGIKTGYTAPAGFNLVASAQRGNKRIIATVFGGKSTAQRNARVAELLDLGFGKAPNRVNEQPPPAIAYNGDDVPADEDLLAEAIAANVDPNIPATAKTLRLNTAVSQSPRPKSRPANGDVALAALASGPMPAPAAGSDEQIAADATEIAAATDTLMASMQDTITAALEEAQAGSDEEAFVQTATPQPETLTMAQVDEPAPADAPTALAADAVAPDANAIRPKARPATLVALSEKPTTTEEPAPAIEPAVAVAAVEPAPSPIPVVAEAVEPAQIDLAALPAEKPLPAAVLGEAEDPAAAKLAAAIVLTPPAQTAPAQDAPNDGQVVLASADATVAPEQLQIVTRVSTSGGREWGINVGSFSSRYNAERELLRTALVEMSTLNDALRKVTNQKGAFDANFVGMTQESATLACSRLVARGTDCKVLSPVTE